MNADEKLKQASLEAELLLLKQIPDDSQIDWEPSEDFLKKMDYLLETADKPKVKMSFFSKFSAVAAVLIIACVAVFLPINRYNNTDDCYTYGLEGGGDCAIGTPDKHTGSTTNNRNEILGVSCNDTDDVPCSDIYDSSEVIAVLPFFPEYIPCGYEIVDSVVESDNITTSIEFSNGKDSFSFYSSAEGFDISGHQSSYVIDWNSNSYYANVTPPSTVNGNRLDSEANNIVWFYGGNSFMLVGNESLSIEEIQKTAISFNLEPYE